MSDAPLPEDDAISAAHPLRTGRHDLYVEAMRLVGARHSKVGLVELVTWLLLRTAVAEKRYLELLVASMPEIEALLTWMPDRDRLHEFAVDQAVARRREDGSNDGRDDG